MKSLIFTLSYFIRYTHQNACYGLTYTPALYGGWRDDTTFNDGVITNNAIIGCGYTASKDVLPFGSRRGIIVSTDFDGGENWAKVLTVG